MHKRPRKKLGLLVSFKHGKVKGISGMNARQLECVLVLAEERSFSEAAKKLGISQPSLSQYIQKIEEDCGNELFERSIPLNLTYAGKLYVQHAKNINRAQKQMREILADISKEEAGKLVVGTGPINSITFLPTIIREYKKRFPKVEIVIEEYYEKELEHMEQSGKVDIVISTRRVDTSKFEYIHLFEEKMLLTICADSEFARTHPATADGEYLADAKDILNLKFIEMDDFFPIQRSLMKIFEGHGVRPEFSVKCGSIMTAYSLAKMGLGSLLLPSGTLKYVKDEHMRYYTLNPAPEGRPFGIYFSKGKYVTRAMREFIDVIKTTV